MAIKSEKPEVVNLLLSDSETGNPPANPNTKTADKENDIILTPLQLALQQICDHSSLNRIVKILVKFGANPLEKDDERNNILHKLAEKGNIELINYILEKHPSAVNELSKYGNILHLSVTHNHTDLVEFILSDLTSLDIFALDDKKNTVLHVAIISESFNCFKQIVDFVRKSILIDTEKKKDFFNSLNDEGNTVLHELAFARSYFLIDFVKKFEEELRVDPEKRNLKGLTFVDIQNDIVRLANEKLEAEKKLREELRVAKLKEKERIKNAEIEKLKDEEDEKKKEEERKKFDEAILKWRGWIAAAVIIILLVGMYYLLKHFSEKKKRGIVL